MEKDLLKIAESFPVIVSRSNGEVCAAAKLKMKKHRDEARLFLCEGEKLFEEATLFGRPERVFIAGDRIGSLSEKTAEYLRDPSVRERAVVLSRPAFEKISTEKAPQGVITAVRYPERFDDSDGSASRVLSCGCRAVVLDSVRDPGNVGGILRSAAAFGVGAAVLVSCADPLGDRAVRASMGAIFKMDISVVGSADEVRAALSGSPRRLVAAALTDSAESLDRAELRPDDIPVIGNEGHGISEDMLALCGGAVKIPMAKDSESLNAGAAAAVILWEYYKTR